MVKRQFDRRKKDTFYDFGVFLKDGSLVGGVSLMEIVRGISHTAYLGYRIFNPHWGQGYAKEVVRMMLEIGFEDIKLHRIEAGVEPGNTRSIALVKALKMRKKGLKKRALFLRNKWVDLVMYTLTCEDLGYQFKGAIPKLESRR